MFELTKDLLAEYIHHNRRHSSYDETVKIYREIKVHSDGETPGNLIQERRPGESQHIFDYRKKIYQPKTKAVIGKILNTLAKIRRSTDWSITYDENQVPKFIPEGEALNDYCEINYPGYSSLTKWYFDVCLKEHMIDPNAVVLVHNYQDEETPENQFRKPVATIFNSDMVLDFKAGKYAFLQSSEKSTYKTSDNKTATDGMVYYYVTPDLTVKLMQSASDKSKFEMIEFKNPNGVFPAFILGAIKKKEYFESRINGVIPSLNVAVTIYSDKQAEIVQHVHSEKWIYQTQQCKDCSGQGKVPKANSAPIECNSCKGLGVVNTSPYSNLIINPNNLPLGEKSIPIPPAGYIQKSDVAAMVTAISAEIKQEIFDAYSAINMEFLMDAPMAESGISKEVDRDDLNNFVYSVAEDIVGVLDKVYYIIACLRYGKQMTDLGLIKKMCPKIPVPEKYDLLSSNYYLDKYDKARAAKVNPLILSFMEVEFSSKEFYNNPEIADLMMAIYKLDPLPGVTQEDKMVMLGNKGITTTDYVISCNLPSFIKQAVNDNKDFFKLDPQAQKQIMVSYADTVIKANSMKSAVLDSGSGSGSGSGN